MTTNLTIHHAGVTIPVTHGGRGRPIVVCPGLNTTQADLYDLAERLRRDHRVVTFDLRGHGLASAASAYTFAAFLGDLEAVLADPERLGLDAPPLLVGYSLGADLAVRYAAENPGRVGGLVLVDGANPVPVPLVTADVLPELRAMWTDLAARRRALRGTPRQVLLTGQEILDLNLEVDAVRSTILGAYAEIDRPISMIMSTAMAGDDAGVFAARLNRNWRAGVERLVRARPDVSASWLDAGHGLLFTHGREIAAIIRNAAGTLVEC